MYIVCLLLTIFILYIAVSSKLYGKKFQRWQLMCIALLTLASIESALIMLGITIYILYNGVKNGTVDTLDWIENLIK